MVERILAHNRLNGLLFSLIEFGLFSLLVAPFAVYYGLHGRWVLFAICVGVICNFLTIVTFAARSLKSGEKSVGHRKLLRREERVEIAKQYPHLMTDTLTLTVTSLLPFVLLVAVRVEKRKR